MHHRPAIMLALLLTCVIAIAPHTYACYVSPTKQAAIDATVINSESREASINHLRQAGPQGLKALADLRDVLVASLADTAMDDRLRDVTGRRITLANEALDAVAQQRYGHVSRLYWHTDLDAALADAKQQKKPVLSLQMLGKLTEEYSCANSRFFRVQLYADPQVSDYLREHYVLHWRSVRDVPIITITLADGSAMKRTITGNSAHFVLDSEGNAINIIPGLWSAEAFLSEVTDTATLFTSLLYHRDRDSHLRHWHKGRLARQKAELAQLLESANLREEQLWTRQGAWATTMVSAKEANVIARSKSIVEIPLLNAADLASTATLVADHRSTLRLVNFGSDEPVPQVRRVRDLRRVVPASDQRALDAVISSQALPTLHADVWSLIASENAHVLRATSDSNAGSQHEQAMRGSIATSVLKDTFINRYALQTEVHQWFVDDLPAKLSREQLVEVLYNVLFMMDLNDPWAGLYDPTIFTGLRDGGMTIADDATPTAVTAQRD